MSLSLTSLCTASSTDLSKSSNLSFSPPSHRSQKAGNDIVLQALIHGPVREDTLLHVSPKNFNWLSNLVNAKKLRLVKRLKNRIETKTGHKIFSSNLVSADSQFNPRKSGCRRSLSSTKTTKIVSKAETRPGQSRNVDNLNVNFLSNRSVCINIDVEPAYF